MTNGRGTGEDSEWRDQCRRWTGNWNGRCGWQGVTLEGSRRPGPGWRGERGGGSWGHRVVRGGGGGATDWNRKGGRAWGRSIVTGLRRKPVGGCIVLKCGDLRSGAPRTILSCPILSYLILLRPTNPIMRTPRSNVWCSVLLTTWIKQRLSCMEGCLVINRRIGAGFKQYEDIIKTDDYAHCAARRT